MKTKKRVPLEPHKFSCNNCNFTWAPSEYFREKDYHEGKKCPVCNKKDVSLIQ